MAKLALCNAIEAALAAGFTQCRIFGIDDEYEPPSDGSAFIIVQYPVSSAEPLTIGDPGNNRHRETGTFRIVIHTPRKKGKGLALGWADTISALFISKTFADGTINTWTPGSPVLNDDNDLGKYFVTSFSVPYWHDFYG